jgi:lysophospholipase L1-like esterase
MHYRRIAFAFLLVVLFSGQVLAQDNNQTRYNIGSPALTNLYVSPTGDNSRDGSSPEQALQTIDEAWNRIPMTTELTTGYHILILPGTYTAEQSPNYWEGRYGTAEHPIIIEAANGQNSAYLPSINMYDDRYVYFMNLNLDIGADAFHCEKCDHLLLRGNTIHGANPDSYNAQETVKINQSQYVFIEDNDISGAWDNAVDFVAVRNGHFLNNRIHDAGDWCMYLKGGSAYFYVANNKYYNCGAGGFTAGQGTGLQYMDAPYIQYEAYDIKFVNNFIHDVQGAGIGVQGGYNILMAYNTMLRVGTRSHVMEFGFGSRSCDGQGNEESRERCDQYNAAGGWGNNAPADGTNYVRIPSRNVLIYNNVVYNPPGTHSAYQQFAIPGAYSGAEQVGSNVANPALADDNLQIRGNMIWNGDASMPLGVDDGAAGCQADNPTCNIQQILADNAINTIDPTQSMLPPVSIPDFTWDVPVPAGDLSNAVGQAVSSEALKDMLATAPTIPDVSPTETSANPEPTLVTAPQSTVVPTPVMMPANPPNIALPLPAGPVTIVTLGDSLTEGAEDNAELGGYPGRLIQMVQAIRPGSTLNNYGHSGWSSDALINGDQGLPSELEQAEQTLRAVSGQPAVALVWIGSNDLFYLYGYNNPDAAGEQADLENYGRNLDTILGRLTQAGARVLIAQLDDQSLRPVVTRGEAFPDISKDEVRMMSEQVKRYNALIAEKAARYGAVIVDFYNTTIFVDVATLADDGNHPNANGYDVVANVWFTVLKGVLGA